MKLNIITVAFLTRVFILPAQIGEIDGGAVIAGATGAAIGSSETSPQKNKHKDDHHDG